MMLSGAFCGFVAHPLGVPGFIPDLTDATRATGVWAQITPMVSAMDFAKRASFVQQAPHLPLPMFVPLEVIADLGKAPAPAAPPARLPTLQA